MNLEQKSRKTVLYSFIILGIVSSFFFYYNLGTSPFIDYDEATYAQITQDTQKAGDLLTLHKGDNVWFEKPPLYFWLAMGSEKVFGADEFGLRFPSATFGILAVVLASLIALELSASPYVAVLAGIILLTSGGFLEAARQVRLDVPVTASILFALYSFLRAKRNPKWYMGIAVAVAVGFLLKSVIALLALPIILIWAFFSKDWKWFKNKYLWYGAVAGLVVLLPWHIYELMHYGSSFWNEYISRQLLQRFAVDSNGSSITNFDYVKYVTLFSFPWALVFGAGVIQVIAKRSKTETSVWLYSLAGSVLFLFCFFFLAHTKLVYYTVPLYPFIAIFCAVFIGKVYESCKTEDQFTFFVLTVVSLLAVALANMVYVGFKFQSDLAASQRLANDEYQISLQIQKHPEITDVKGFKYNYFETINYYSGRNVSFIQDGDPITNPTLVVSYSIPYKSHWFTPDLMKHLEPLYVGDDVALLLYRP